MNIASFCMTFYGSINVKKADCLHFIDERELRHKEDYLPMSQNK